MTFLMFSGSWNRSIFESRAAREYHATGHLDLPAQPPVLKISEKIPDRESEAGEGWGQHGMRAGTVSSLHPIPGTGGASGKRSPLRCAAPGAAE